MVKVRTSYKVYGTKLKNLMESFIHQHIKDRIECFDDHFSCRKPDQTMIGSMFGTG
jgi:hypothetical protein